jgi:hypothetical protein
LTGEISIVIYFTLFSKKIPKTLDIPAKITLISLVNEIHTRKYHFS